MTLKKLNMLYQKAIVYLIIQFYILQTISHTIDIRNTKVFEIALDDLNYDEESENEMIQSKDLVNLKPLAEDENRYGPLHSHVKYYNEHNVENKKQYPNLFFYLQSRMKEIFNLKQENKPFVAGFKHNLDKITDVTSINNGSNKNKKNKENFKRSSNYWKCITDVVTDKNVKSIRIKHKETTNRYKTTLKQEMDFFQMIKDRYATSDEIERMEKTPEIHKQYNLYENVEENTNEDRSILEQFQILQRSTLADMESSYEESYDYERLKMEYNQQLEHDVKEGKILNYTEKEKPKKGILKKIMDLKQPTNCTKEELGQIGIKAIKCLLYDYQRAKDITAAKIILSRTWLVFQIWLLIYICLAIPCWCQRGWCCCCFRCRFCFPQKTIIFAKQYYIKNPPGIFLKDLKKEKEPIKYEATEYEHNAYKTFETAIKHI